MWKHGRSAWWSRGAGSAARACAILAVVAWISAAAMAPDLPAPSGPPTSNRKIDWGTDRGKAMAAARRDGKPLLIYFSATWCRPCREMEASLWSRPDVIAMAGRFVCLYVDIDRDASTAHRYGAESVPAVSISDPWGTELARREGYGGPDMYVALLRAVPADFGEAAPWQERLAADPRDVEALRQVGLAYHRLNLFDASTAFLERVLRSEEVKAHPDVLAEVLTMVGWNHLKSHDYKSARKSFERCLKQVPSHPALDVTLYGLLAVDLATNEPGKAVALLGRLESCCPESDLTARARKDLASPPVPSR
jgi:hypothetical protein